MPRQPLFQFTKSTIRSFPPVLTGAELLQNEKITTPIELVSGVLHRNAKGVLASSSKAGKTWILLDLAISVATGQQWLDRATTKAPVLFVNFEIPLPFFRERIRAVAEAKGSGSLDDLHVWTLRGNAMPLEDLLPALEQAVTELEIGLIILDPIYKTLAGADENRATDIATLCNALERLCTETGAALVYAHHFSKGNKVNQPILDRMSGSGVFARDADSIISLTQHHEENCYTMDFTLRNFPKVDPVVVEWEFPILRSRPDLAATRPVTKSSKIEQRAALLLELLPEYGLSATDWEQAAQACGVSRAVFHRDLKKFRAAGLIEKVGRAWTRTDVSSPKRPKAAENETDVSPRNVHRIRTRCA